ncbi:hypothetical protein [Anaerovibrio lipolyticus]|uniref:hypothetical protein n=1 Tax=Anaerovibrio lipolyticus TaxID=82374 RepID=UPI0026EA8E3A|nr:hypothetical protein [Anaerovibrio lipolyticus]MBE6104983.1 hypothetical protein [Anaerovibrio lipolyticus]
MVDIKKLASRLEGILRDYLKCHYTEFNVKANDNITFGCWREPIIFALGYKYAQSGDKEVVKAAIEELWGNDLIGENISEICQSYTKYGFESEEKAYDKIKEIIDTFENILRM